MKDKFVDIINYLEELNNNLKKDEMSNEEKLLLIIKYAILNDRFHQGSIIFTKDNNMYKISTIQKYSYARTEQDKIIDIDNIIEQLNALNIEYTLEYFPISNHKNDYELSFGISKLNNTMKRTRTM